MAGVKGQRSGGHNAKTPDQHRTDGTYRPDRHGESEGPEPPQGLPKPPKALSKGAKAEWDRMVKRLETSRTVSVVDDAALYQYVNLFEETEVVKSEAIEARKLSKQLKRAAQKLDGQQLVDAIDRIVELHKMVAGYAQRLRMQRTALRTYLVEFGMTPASRGRVRVAKDAEKKGSKLLAFMGGRGPSGEAGA